MVTQRMRFMRQAVLAIFVAIAGNSVSAAECSEENRCTRIVGIGLAAVQEDMDSSWAEKRVVAVRAAKLDALRSIAEQVNGIKFQSQSQYGRSRLNADRFSISSAGTISGVKFVRVEPLEEGIYQAIAEMDLRY